MILTEVLAVQSLQVPKSIEVDRTQLFGTIGLVLMLVGITVLITLLIRRGKHKRSLQGGHEFAVLLVLVPKESGEKESQQRPLQEQIAPAEVLFSILGGMHSEKGLRTAFSGRKDHFALEIVALKGQISFYVVVPREQQQFFEEQVHAQYPTAQFEEVDDYNAFSPTGIAVGTELAFLRPSALPIRTYRKSEGDPLNALTNTLSRLADNEAGIIQFLLRPARQQWHNQSSKLIEGLRDGKKLKELLHSSGTKNMHRVVTASLFAKPEEKPQDRQLTQSDQQLIELLEEKNSKAGFETNIRLVISAEGDVHAKQKLQGLIDAFSQYRTYEQGNGFHGTGMEHGYGFMERLIYRTFHAKHTVILNAEEMASLFHLPLPTTETPKINWLTARRLPAPVNIPTTGVLLGENVFRGHQTLIHMKREDRRRHMYIIGTTGSGKSILQANMAIQDIRDGEGVAVIDPHGTLVDLILENIPPGREKDVIYFDPSDVERPIGLNILEARNAQEADFAVQEMIAIFYKLVTDPSMIGPMFEHNMRNAMLTLMANPEFPGTIADIPRIFTDPDFQKYSVKFVTDPIVRAFWEKEMAKTTDYHKSEMLGYLISKVGRFVENAMIRNIIGQPKSGFNFRDIMDSKKIFLANLSKGKTGEMNSNLLGLIIVSKLQMAALSRADTPESQINDFFLYIDEFQNFITDSIAIILSEARKYKLNLSMAHQYISQLVQNNDTKVRDAVFGNVGTVVAFRVGVDDAETLAQQLAPVVNEYDLINIEKYHAYTRLLIDNTASRPFTLATFPPPLGDHTRAMQLKAALREQYGRPREEVESEILTRTKLGSAEAPLLPSNESHA